MFGVNTHNYIISYHNESDFLLTFGKEKEKIIDEFVKR